ncbi:SWIM zinc finger family protein [Chloracidobacterium thermophilum]|uniref:SWIM zinc finger family protein n=1 Tax=Chloracidobacterium thermophilum TaxID=458033 RepID=UPI001BB2E70A|nr:SWIM zinc finger family protein [Chloracidobacterium thermophilum]
MTYRVELLHDDDVLVVSCTCPYFEEGQVCKHIWATVRLAEEQKRLPAPPVNRPFRLLMAELERPDEGDESDEETGGGLVSSRGTAPRLPSPPPGGGAGLPNLDSRPVWPLRMSPNRKFSTSSTWRGHSPTACSSWMCFRAHANSMANGAGCGRQA